MRVSVWPQVKISEPDLNVNTDHPVNRFSKSVRKPLRQPVSRRQTGCNLGPRECFPWLQCDLPTEMPTEWVGPPRPSPETAPGGGGSPLQPRSCAAAPSSPQPLRCAGVQLTMYVFLISLGTHTHTHSLSGGWHHSRCHLCTLPAACIFHRGRFPPLANRRRNFILLVTRKIETRVCKPDARPQCTIAERFFMLLKFCTLRVILLANDAEWNTTNSCLIIMLYSFALFLRWKLYELYFFTRRNPFPECLDTRIASFYNQVFVLLYLLWSLLIQKIIYYDQMWSSTYQKRQI